MKKAPAERATERARASTAAADADELRPEYDFSGGDRGRHAARFAEGATLVLLDPDVARAFPDAAAVNEALRALAGIIERNRASG